MDSRASGGVHITRYLLGMAARARCGRRNVCLSEHPMRKLVTDNLDNFSNLGDKHRLSIPSTPRDKATLTLPLAPTLPCSEVIAVTEVIGYRRSHPCKECGVRDDRAKLSSRLLLLMVKLAVLLDPSRSLYSSASTGPRSHHQYHPVVSKMLKWSSSASSRSKSWFPTRKPSSAFKSTST
jgi:hypothetical protein